MQALTDAGVGYFNAENVYLFKKNGVNIAFCGFWCTAYQRDGAQFRETVRKLKQQGANAVVVSLHFGQEYHTLHNTAQTSIAHEYRAKRERPDGLEGGRFAQGEQRDQRGGQPRDVVG